MTQGNLAVLLHDQGRLDEAEAVFEAVVQGQDAALGPDSTQTLWTKGKNHAFLSLFALN